MTHGRAGDIHLSDQQANNVQQLILSQQFNTPTGLTPLLSDPPFQFCDPTPIASEDAELAHTLSMMASQPPNPSAQAHNNCSENPSSR
jgi:hypothetical protein